MKKLLPLLLLLLLLAYAACASPAEPMSEPPLAGGQTTMVEPTPPEPQITVEEANELAAAAYPPPVTFSYEETARISGIIFGAKEGEALCHLFNVFATDNGRCVSRVAVDVTDGTLWFADMETLDRPEALWLREDFMGDSPMGEQPAEREPYIEYQSGGNADTLYLAGIDFIPEFTNINEGGVAWFPAEQRLELSLTKGMGSHGTLEGPQLLLSVQWVDEQPQITNKEFVPAPIFSNPKEVLNSGAEIFIEDARLIEIATQLREIIEQYEEDERL